MVLKQAQVRLGAVRRYTYIEKASAVGGLGLPLHPIRGAPAARRNRLRCKYVADQDGADVAIRAGS